MPDSFELFLDYLVKNQVLDQEQMRFCLEESNTKAKEITDILIQEKYCNSKTLIQYLAQFDQEKNTNLVQKIFPKEHPITQVVEEENQTTPFLETFPKKNPLHFEANTNSEKNLTTNIPISKDRYILLETIGEGGMGIVQRAKDKVLGRIVALKKVHQQALFTHQLSQKEKFKLWRLSQEASLTAALEHPNIIPLYDIQDNGEGELYFTMRRVEGETFGDILKKKREEPEIISQEQILSIFFKVCDAVSYAHSKDVIHRDLKPENIMVGKFGEVYVMDWGIAKKISSKASPKPHKEKTAKAKLHEEKTLESLFKTIETEILDIEEKENFYSTIGGLGTVGYMAPEQQKDASLVTPQSDIYALGIILRQCFTLATPYEEMKLQCEIIEKQFNIPLNDENQEQKDPFESLIPPDLRAIIKKATAKEPMARYLSVKKLILDIERFQKNFRVSARDYNSFQLFSKWILRNIKVLILFGSLLFLLISFGIYVQISKRQQQEQRFQIAYQKAKKARKQANANKEIIGTEIKSLLKALNYLNVALMIKPFHKELEQQKYEVGQKLIQLTCQSEDYELADYVVTELETLSFLSNEEKEQFALYLQTEKTQLLKKHQQRLQYWLKELKRRPNKKTKEKAIFEISQMKEKAILQDLLANLAEKTSYILQEKPKDIGSIFCAHTLLETISSLKNSTAISSLIQLLQKMEKKLAPLKENQREEIQINFMLQILATLTKLKPKGLSESIQKIRHSMGINSPFFQKSENLYEQIVAFETLTATPKTTAEFVKQGEIKKALGDFKGAIIEWTKSIEKDPKNFQTYLLRAFAYFKLKKYKETLEDLEKVIQLNPKCSEAYIRRGDLKLETGKPFEAIQDFKKSIQLAPEKHVNYRKLGMAARLVKDYKESIAAFDKAISINPNSVYTWVLRGIAKYESGDIKGALSDYNWAILHNPNHANAFSNRGVVLLHQGDLTRALFDFNHAIELGKMSYLNFFNRGEVWERMGEYSKAILDYQQTLQINPKFIPAYAKTAECFQKLGRLEQAIKSYEQILQMKKIPQLSQFIANLLAKDILQRFKKGETTSLEKQILLFKKHASPSHPKHKQMNAVLKEIKEK